MESNNHKAFGSEFTMTDPGQYIFAGRMVAPDGRVRNVIYHKEKDQHGYIVKPRYTDDKSFYAPYILDKIGQKVGVRTPETALGLFIILEQDELTYRDSFFDSSCVFVDNSSMLSSRRDIANISPEVAYAIFASANPEQAEKHREGCSANGARALPMTIDEYIDSTIFMLTSRGNKPQSEYTSGEIAQMRQEIIDRIALGLKLGIKGDATVVTYQNRNARLSSYYLSSHNMFGLNLRKEWISEQMDKNNDEFATMMASEFPVQYGIKPNIVKPNAQDVMHYLFDKYPEEAEKAYKQVRRYTLQDLEADLNSFTVLDEAHKKFALKVFDTREQELQRVYMDYDRDKALER